MASVKSASASHKHIPAVANKSKRAQPSVAPEAGQLDLEDRDERPISVESKRARNNNDDDDEPEPPSKSRAPSTSTRLTKAPKKAKARGKKAAAPAPTSPEATPLRSSIRQSPGLTGAPVGAQSLVLISAFQSYVLAFALRDYSFASHSPAVQHIPLFSAIVSPPFARFRSRCDSDNIYAH